MNSNLVAKASNRWLLLAGFATFMLAVITVNQHAFAAGIADTRHNLGSTNVIVGGNRTTDTAEICVFCHTPHFSAVGADKPPLWNKRLGAGGLPPGGGTYSQYTTATSSTITGEVLAVGSVSVACLSCHDGTQAMDNIINAPGSGGIDTTGGGNGGLNWTWFGSGVGATGLMTGAAGLIGTDLVNDHPIGIEYCGGGISGTTNTTGCTDQDFKGGSTTGLNYASINTFPVWWVDTGGAGVREKTDMILYTRTFAAGAGPSVECASCHDPHSTNATFLRTSNAGSAVCLACHVK